VFTLNFIIGHHKVTNSIRQDITLKHCITKVILPIHINIIYLHSHLRWRSYFLIITLDEMFVGCVLCSQRTAVIWWNIVRCCEELFTSWILTLLQNTLTTRFLQVPVHFDGCGLPYREKTYSAKVVSLLSGPKVTLLIIFLHIFCSCVSRMLYATNAPWLW